MDERTSGGELVKITDIHPMVKEDGEVGIEVEVEGDALPVHVIGWNKLDDGSLRGESCEYVLKKPCTRDKVKLYTNRIGKAYKDAGSVIHNSDRTSVHIHINIQELSLTQLYNFILLFLILEEPLVNFCGKNRVNNLFCLRSLDAEGLLTVLEDCATLNTISNIRGANVRYASVNIAAVFKFGSLEFRSLNGTNDMERIQKWVEILLKLKDAAIKYPDPIAIVEQFSIKGTDLWVREIMGKHRSVITKEEGWRDVLFSSMRNIQTIAYSGDWRGLSSEPFKEAPGQEEEED